MSESVVLTFATTHAALDAEAAIAACGITVEPVPTPAITGTRCGIAMRVAARDRDSATKCLLNADIPFADVLELDAT